MNVKKLFIFFTIISTILAIYLINKYKFDWIVIVHWLLISIPALIYLKKKK